VKGEKFRDRTMRFQACDLLEVVCGGLKPVSPLPTSSARRRFASRRRRDVVVVVPMTMRLWFYPCLSGSGTHGGRWLREGSAVFPGLSMCARSETVLLGVHLSLPEHCMMDLGYRSSLCSIETS
jgi:hypothetical protein